MYKEFKIFKKLFAITGFGIHLITDKGDYGLRIHRDCISLRSGISQKFYYYKNILN